jgi:hypothetical protein
VSRMDEFQCFLEFIISKSRMNMGGRLYLRLCKHVNQPAAHCSICTACDQVVGILCSDHLHCIDGVRVSSSR